MVHWAMSLVVGIPIGLAVEAALAADLPDIDKSRNGMRVTSSDASAVFMTVGLNKSVVIDLENDVSDVLVADPKTISIVVRTKRRIFIIGLALGETNVYLFDSDGRQLGALDLTVVSGTPLPPNQSNPFGQAANMIVVFRGSQGALYSCTPTTCIGAEKPDNTVYSQITTISK